MTVAGTKTLPLASTELQSTQAARGTIATPQVLHTAVLGNAIFASAVLENEFEDKTTLLPQKIVTLASFAHAWNADDAILTTLPGMVTDGSPLP